jgi:hypothetical protein
MPEMGKNGQIYPENLINLDSDRNSTHKSPKSYNT